MPKVTLTTQGGTKILIDGTASEVKELIARIEERQEIDFSGSTKQKTRKQKGRKNTATGVILSFRESGYFNKPKNLLEIKASLAEQGMIYPTTTLSPLLLKLVRKRLLGRVKEKKRWSYVKR